MSVNSLRTFFRKLHLQNRILLITIAILLLWGLFCFISFRWVVFDLLSKQVSDHYEKFANFLAQSIAPRITGADVEGIVSLIKEARSGDTHLEYVSVFDEKGRLLAGKGGKQDAVLHQEPLYTMDADEKEKNIHFKEDGEKNDVHHFLIPIKDEAGTTGYMKLGVSDKAFQHHFRKIEPLFFLSLGALILISCFVALKLSNNMTRPVARLTQLADEISQGNLDVNIDFGEHVNCWEIKHCRRNDCAAYENTEVQCWFVDGTPCEGYEPRFPQKLGQCRQCEVYQAHRGDEIVQLADSFKHMTYKLKSSQKDLRGAYNLQKCLIQNSFDGIIASDVNGVILIFNHVAELLTGFSQEEVVGKKAWRNFFRPDILKEIHKPLREDGSKGFQGFVPRESVIFRRNGSFIPVLMGGVPLIHKEQDVGHVAFFYDIRELKRLRMDLIQSERMAAVGQTVASISHSIKNILDGLRGGVFVYNHGRENNDLDKKRLGWEMIEKNVDIISELVIDLLNYSKERELSFQNYAPNKLVKEVCMIMQRKAENRQIQLHWEGDEDVEKAVFDPFAMHQCLLNLVSNAVDAIPSDRNGRVLVKTFRDKEKNLCFRVSDNGMGISREIKDKILKGIFSTKGSKGTGLGLLVVQKIVKEHQGTFEIVSKEGRGTEFTVSLPCPASPLTAVEQALGQGERRSFS